MKVVVFTGQLFHDGQILPFKSDKHDTVLLVQISKLKLEGAESDRKVEELFGIVSGRVKKNIEVLLDERSPIPFNHVYQFDDQESVDLGDSEDEDHDRASAIHVAAT